MAEHGVRDAVTRTGMADNRSGKNGGRCNDFVEELSREENVREKDIMI